MASEAYISISQCNAYQKTKVGTVTSDVYNLSRRPIPSISYPFVYSNHFRRNKNASIYPSSSRFLIERRSWGFKIKMFLHIANENHFCLLYLFIWLLFFLSNWNWVPILMQVVPRVCSYLDAEQVVTTANSWQASKRAMKLNRTIPIRFRHYVADN